MSNQRKDGGPAYPIWTPDMNVGDDAGPGLSKLDWFAAQAVPALIACGNLSIGPDEPNDNDRLAACAYAFAKAMLAHSRASDKEGAAS